MMSGTLTQYPSGGAPPVVRSQLVQPVHLPSNNMQIHNPYPASQYQRKLAWTGYLEWLDTIRADQNRPPNRITRLLACQVSVGPGDVLKTDKWPNKLIMQLIPQNLLSSLGQILQSSKTVAFHFARNDPDSLKALYRVMASTGRKFAGCVHLHSAQQCEVKVLLLIFSPRKKAFVGLIPHDQASFMIGIRSVIANYRNVHYKKAMAAQVQAARVQAAPQVQAARVQVAPQVQASRVQVAPHVQATAQVQAALVQVDSQVQAARVHIAPQVQAAAQVQAAWTQVDPQVQATAQVQATRVQVAPQLQAAAQLQAARLQVATAQVQAARVQVAPQVQAPAQIQAAAQAQATTQVQAATQAQAATHLQAPSTSSGDPDEETINQFNNQMASCLQSTDVVQNNLQAVIPQTSDSSASSLQTQYSSIIAELKSTLTCKICLQLIQGNVAFLQCCSQIAGCGQCVQMWFEKNDTCPWCRDPDGIDKVIPFRGLDDVLNKMKDLDFTPLDG